ncbi:MAG: hypothetical protein ACKVOU_02040 [Cytophagales bacterium]
MTPKQIERIGNRIKQIKVALAADKKHWGGFYHDGRGLRYLPPQLYISIDDFAGALRYFNWFHKNFPSDSCYSTFLYEWTIVLFKTGRLKEAEKKALEVFCSDNGVLFKILQIGDANMANDELANKYLNELKNKGSLADFNTWILHLIRQDFFLDFCNKYIELEKRIETEPDKAAKQLLQNQLELLSSKM